MRGWKQHTNKCCGDCTRGDDEPLECLRVYRNGILIGFLTAWGSSGKISGNTKCRGGLKGARYCNPKCSGTLACEGDAKLPVTYGFEDSVTLSSEIGWNINCNGKRVGVPGLWNHLHAGNFPTDGITWLGTPSTGCTTVDLTFHYYRFTSPNTCTLFTATLSAQALDWYVYGVTFVDPDTSDEYFIVECNSTYPRAVTRPAPTCFTVKRPDGSYDIYKDLDVYLYGSTATHQTSSCGSAISQHGSVSALGGEFSWSITADHDYICFYWSRPNLDGSHRYVCIPWVAEWWNTELPLNVDGYVIESISDCTTLPPPCEPYNCYPTCLVKLCNSVDVNPNALFIHISSLNGCCLNGDYEFTWDGTKYYSGKIGDPFLVTCGYIEIWYECVGHTFRRRIKTTDVNGNTNETTLDNAGNCTGAPINFEDTFDLLSSLVTPLCFNVAPFFSDTITCDIFTNN